MIRSPLARALGQAGRLAPGIRVGVALVRGVLELVSQKEAAARAVELSDLTSVAANAAVHHVVCKGFLGFSFLVFSGGNGGQAFRQGTPDLLYAAR